MVLSGAWRRAVARVIVVASSVVLSGCIFNGDDDGELPRKSQPVQLDARATGLAAAAAVGAGVNSFLWRASLDTISFMPLSGADPYGGVIITDWYSAPESPNERFKITVYILDQDLRADGIKISVFKQTREPFANWINAPISSETGIKIENTILVRARQLRLRGFKE